MGGTEDAGVLVALFRSLEGPWALERKLNSSNASEPSGRCHGVAHFTSRPPSKVESVVPEPGEVVGEMLYREDGQFQMQAPSGGAQMPYMTFSRNYIWRLKSDAADSGHPACSVWFAKPGTTEPDYLFHGLLIDGRTKNGPHSESRQSVSTVRAHGSHLCVEDQYETDYVFTFAEHHNGSKLSLAEWQTVHTVKGPKKDQRIETTFTRKDGGLEH